MKKLLSESDKDKLNKRITGAEEQTNAQIVLATIGRCDNYAEVPWKAFAVGASAAGLLIFLLDLFLLRWTTNTTVLFSLAIILLSGAGLSLLTILFPCFAGLFIARNRKEFETMQYAESLFLSRELFATEGRRGILLLISRFEKQVVILPDKGVRNYFKNDVMESIISNMIPDLRKNKISIALETGLNEIVKAFSPPLPEGLDINELSNEIIEEEGV